MANFQLGTDQKVPYTIVELDATGSPVAPKPENAVEVTSSDSNSATAVADVSPTPGTSGSGFVVAGSKIQPDVVITATITYLDGSKLSATQTVDVVPAAVTGPKAASLKFEFGTAQSQ